MNIFNLQGGETMCARNNENFRTPGKNRTHNPLNTISDIPTTEPEGREFNSCQASMVSPPSKLKMFSGDVCVLLTSVSLKLSFRIPAEKNKQE